MKTDFDKNIKIDKNIKKEKNIKMDKNMQAENIHKNVDEITINDFATKNNKDALNLFLPFADYREFQIHLSGSVQCP